MNGYDILIIGGGPAGLTSGIYAARDRIKTLLLEKMVLGGQVLMADLVENYPGFAKGISGQELVARMEEQVRRFGLAIENTEAISLEEGEGSEWVVRTRDNKEYGAKAVIIATGAKPARLNIPGEERLVGKGVSYCATCDGPLFRDKEVLVIGGGDTALSEALSLAKFASKVRIIHRRDRLRAVKVLQEKALNNPRLNFILNSVVTEVLGDETLEAVRIKDVVSGKEKEIKAPGLFIFIGLIPNSSFLKGTIGLDDAGFVITDQRMATSVEGIYAAGDVRSTPFRQIVTACGDGAIAGLSARHYLEESKIQDTL